MRIVPIAMPLKRENVIHAVEQEENNTINKIQKYS